MRGRGCPSGEQHRRGGLPRAGSSVLAAVPALLGGCSFGESVPRAGLCCAGRAASRASASEAGLPPAPGASCCVHCPGLTQLRRAGRRQSTWWAQKRASQRHGGQGGAAGPALVLHPHACLTVKRATWESHVRTCRPRGSCHRVGPVLTAAHLCAGSAHVPARAPASHVITFLEMMFLLKCHVTVPVTARRRTPRKMSRWSAVAADWLLLLPRRRGAGPRLRAKPWLRSPRCGQSALPSPTRCPDWPCAGDQTPIRCKGGTE